MVSMDSDAAADSCIPDTSYIDFHPWSIQCTCLIPVCVMGQLEQLGNPERESSGCFNSCDGARCLTVSRRGRGSLVFGLVGS
jgi:hypothetical protein